MSTVILYSLAAILLMISWIKDKKKTKKALKKALKSFENILPQFLTVLLIIGLLLAIVDKDTISQLLGNESGIIGMMLAAIIGSITLIAGFVAFPLASSLLNAGAGYGQIAMFVTTLMMGGIVTIPVETEYFGKKTTYRRNALALIFSIIVSMIIGGVM